MAKGQSKYLNQTKIINGIACSTTEYKNSKLKVVAHSYEGELWVVTSTWKGYDDNSTTTKRSSLHPESKRFKEAFKEKVKEVAKEVVEEVKEIVNDVLDVLCGFEDDLQAFRKYIAKMFCRVVSTDGTRALNHIYKKMSKKYHPDICKHPNAHELMKIINDVYHGIY